MNKIDAIRFGLAGGFFGALLCFTMTLLASVNGFGLEMLNLFRSIFIGYEVSIFGSVVGSGYGFVAGFIGFFLIAFIYNLLGPMKDEVDKK